MSNYTFNYYQYKQKLKQKSNLSFIPLIIIICLLTLCLSFFKPKDSFKISFYMVEVGNFATYSQASVLASNIYSKGGAGYIFFDGSYRVFANVYLMETEAESVKDNIKSEYNASVYNLSTKKKPNLEKYSEKQKKAIDDYADFCLNSINNITELILKFDKNEIDQDFLRKALSSFKSNSNQLCNDVISTFSSNSKYNHIKEHANNLNLSFTDLCNSDYSASLKYSLIKLVINYCYFIDNL